jgi:hypothetical protein
MLHYVLTTKPSIVVGGHFYRFCYMYRTAVSIFDSALTGKVSTNAHHEAQWEILRRMVMFLNRKETASMHTCGKSLPPSCLHGYPD